MRKLYEKIALMSLGLLLVLGQGPIAARAVEIVVEGNGSGSSNEVQTQVQTTTSVQQTNQADITNDVDTNANTGENVASGNTGGDVGIVTGDANQNLSIENSVNSSVAETQCCSQDLKVNVSGNGSESVNKAYLAINNSTGVEINQTANVSNHVDGSANTGKNQANRNTGGEISIDTGNIYANAEVISGPINYYSARVPSGGGDLSVIISDNAASSENRVAVRLDNVNDVFVNNDADIENYIVWELNTGKNEANGNTDADVNITTGDIFFDLLIKNGPINLGEVIIPCCSVYDPGGNPDDGNNPPPSDGGSSSGGGGGNGGSSGGSILSSAAATEAGGPGIVGLSDTSSQLAQMIFFWAGIIMIVTGAKLIEPDSSSKISS